MEVEVGAPGLVDDQRQVALVGGGGEALEVGAGAEVGRRDDHRGDRVRGGVERRGERVRGERVRDPQFGIEFGGGEGGPEAAHHHPVDHRGVDVALDDHLFADVGEGEAGGVVALRGAVDEEPGPPRSPGLGGEDLRLLERSRFGPDVDPLGDRGDVVAEAGVADQLAQGRVGAGAALVAGDLEAPRVAFGVGEQSVDVGGRVLTRIGHCWRLVAMKHTPHGYWLEEAGEPAAAPPLAGRPQRRCRRARRRLHGDVGGLAPEGARAGGPRRPARGIDLRSRPERPQRRLLQRDVVLAAEHARALGRRRGAGGGRGVEGSRLRGRGVLRVAGGRCLVPPRRLPAGLDRPRPGRDLERDRRRLPRDRCRGRGRAARRRGGRRPLQLARLPRRRLLCRLGDGAAGAARVRPPRPPHRRRRRGPRGLAGAGSARGARRRRGEDRRRHRQRRRGGGRDRRRRGRRQARPAARPADRDLLPHRPHRAGAGRARGGGLDRR